MVEKLTSAHKLVKYAAGKWSENISGKEHGCAAFFSRGKGIKSDQTLLMMFCQNAVLVKVKLNMNTPGWHIKLDSYFQ